MLLPVVTAIAFAIARSGGGAGKARVPIPMFLFGFAALVALNSLGLLPKPAVTAAADVSRACLVVAIAALGMKTSFKSLIEAGWRPVAAMALETLWLAGPGLGGGGAPALGAPQPGWPPSLRKGSPLPP